MTTPQLLSNTEKVAVVAWEVTPIRESDGFFRHLNHLIEQSYQKGASVVVLPELFEVELLKILPEDGSTAVAAKLLPFAERIEQELLRLAQSLKITIIGGSHLRNASGKVINAAPIATATQGLFFQPKNCRTQWEIDPWGIDYETGITRLPNPKLGVLVCYDSEFPESGRKLAELGVELLCVPTYTESQHGFQRVNWCCRARAIENEIFVAQACLVGPIECFGLGTAYGKSSIMTPSKGPFPPDAVLAETPLNKEGIAIAEIDFNVLQSSRLSGDARPWSDRALSKWQLR
jgi:predicted amidohydrolase